MSDESLGNLLEQLEEELAKDEEKHGNIFPVDDSFFENRDEIVVKNIESKAIHYKPKAMLGDTQAGTLVSVRPVNDDTTYLGIYLGEFLVENIIAYRDKSQSIQINGRSNPAIFIPELKQVVFGFESWWGEIESEDQLKQITDQDIENQPYVKLLREMLKQEQKIS